MKTPGPDQGKLLRWYPRAWRERYGEEFLALVEDSLDGGAPTLGLRLSVAWAGLRERGHQARLTAARRLPTRGAFLSRWLVFGVVGYIFAVLPDDWREPPPLGRGWQVTAALNTELGVAVFGGATIAASGLLALPAFTRFLRSGGWPKIRRRVAWATGTTAAAGGGLAWLILATGVRTFDQLNRSLTYFLGIVATGLLLAVALGLWTYAATATARHLRLSSRARAAEKVLHVLTAAAAYVMISANLIRYSALQSSVPSFLVGVAGVTGWAVAASLEVRLVIRKGRRRRSAP